MRRVNNGLPCGSLQKIALSLQQPAMRGLSMRVFCSLVLRPLFFFLCGGGEKKGLVDLQYIFCAAGSKTFGDH